jgi:hypothetical protein
MATRPLLSTIVGRQITLREPDPAKSEYEAEVYRANDLLIISYAGWIVGRVSRDDLFDPQGDRFAA